MSAPRGHHSVAQLYQRGFARRRGKTWQVRVMQRASGADRVSNVADTFKRRDWNTVLDEDGTKDFAIEHILADLVDAPAAPVFAAMRNGEFPLDDQQKDRLVRFISAQLSRGRHIRENLARFMVDVQRKTLRLAAQHYSDEKWVEVIGHIPSDEEREVFMNSERYVDFKPTTAGLLGPLLGNVDEVGGLLLGRAWTLVRFAEPCLFTSEHPVIYINPSGHPMGYGVVTADQVYLPVSTTHGLVLSHPWAGWPPALVDGHVELARRLNWAALSFPTSEELLLHPDVGAHPLPGAVLASGSRWPWPEEEHGGGPIPEYWRRMF